MTKTIMTILSKLFCVTCLVLIFLFGGVRLFGLTPLVVTSGSMAPKYQVGTVVYIKEINPKDLRAGDDISFMFDSDTVATHRIVSIDQEKQVVHTVGINNLDHEGQLINDSQPVKFSDIKGRVTYSVPKIGQLYLKMHQLF
ncbi:signal peptidase, endoplasmic reticulum-type [Granulicatella balaenopterae]|uniref:Signal peptidase I n=1 Tax=Granulicatella balaenopterae TaxID=137733 RepID=A0A1H9LFL5_9LACT|nr:signal peptidase I [Granulicatella balaenopterae]SER10281.1 signal peptidase, endoplasmic reticulum-type [Granulicatella balaenopterae]